MKNLLKIIITLGCLTMFLSIFSCSSPKLTKEVVTKDPIIEPVNEIVVPVQVPLIEKDTDNIINNTDIPKLVTKKPKKIITPSLICSNILDLFLNPSEHLLPTDKLRSQYKLKKDLRTESKSGAFPAVVESTATGKIEFLKIFPKLTADLNQKTIKKTDSFLEIYHTCQLAQLNSHINLPPDVPASRFFVDVYRAGMLTTHDPFDLNNGKNDTFYPYMLSEAVDNLPLTKLATEPHEAIKALGFDLNSAPRMVLPSILLQIIVALKNAYEIGLVHNDLHTGNILLSKKEDANFSIHYAGKKMKLTGPLVKIIDFGLGESTEFKQKRSLKFSVWIKNRPFIMEMSNFIDAARNEGNPLRQFDRFRMYLASENQDIYMINLIIRALKYELIKNNHRIPNKTYCSNYESCIELVSQWWD